MDNLRILIVDDNPGIHEDLTRILPCKENSRPTAEELALDQATMDVFGSLLEDDSDPPAPALEFELDHAYQGQEGYDKVTAALADNAPYALLFVDVRMPPGWDGIETIQRVWQKDPYAEVIICTAFSDYNWERIVHALGPSDQLQFLRKPFDAVSVKQMALAATRKWNLALGMRRYTEQLEKEVQQRTRALEEKIAELQQANHEISQLRRILPMCAWCHKVRTDDDYWHQVDEYLNAHANVDISHSMCPECYQKIKDEFNESQDTKKSSDEPL